MKFRRKALEVEASQWWKNGDHPLDYEREREGLVDDELMTMPGKYAKEHEWEGDIVRYFRHPAILGTEKCPYCRGQFHTHGWIDPSRNKGAEFTVCPGDWIVTFDGMHFPIKPDAFAKEYEDPINAIAIDVLHQADKNAIYRERDQLVCALSKIFPSALERHPDDEPWEDDWRWIVFIELPTGQVSWHIHDSELNWFNHLLRRRGVKWDGHTTEQKYQRLAELFPLKSADTR